MAETWPTELLALTLSELGDAGGIVMVSSWSRRTGAACRRSRTSWIAAHQARYGSAPLGIINSVALKGNVLDWIEMRWAGKGADKRLDPFKFALSGRPGVTPSGCRSTTCTVSRASMRAPTA